MEIQIICSIEWLQQQLLHHNGNIDVSNTPPSNGLLFNLAAQAVFMRTIS